MDKSQIKKETNKKINEIVSQIPFRYDYKLQASTILCFLNEKHKNKSWYEDMKKYPCDIYDLLKGTTNYIFEYRNYKCYMFRLYLSWIAIIDISHIRYIVLVDDECININFLNELIDCDVKLQIMDENNSIIAISYADIDDIDIFEYDDFDETGPYSYKSYDDVKNELYSVIDQFIYLMKM